MTTANFVRSIVKVSFWGILGFGGWFGYDNYVRPGLAAFARVGELEAELGQQKLANKLLKVDKRIAQIRVIEVGNDEKSGHPFAYVEFTEVDDQGQPMEKPRPMRLLGDKIYVDGLVVKFDDRFIEKGEALRSTSLFMLKRIFGTEDGLQGGYALDFQDGVVTAAAYSNHLEVTQFEKEIWAEFWEISNDPIRRDELGIRSNHGQINYFEPKTGKIFEFTLRSSGGGGIRVIN